MEKVVDVFFQPGILSNNVAQKFLVFGELSFEVFYVPQVNIILEPVDIHTSSERGFIISKEVIDFGHSRLISSVNELSCGRLEAYRAFVAAL